MTSTPDVARAYRAQLIDALNGLQLAEVEELAERVRNHAAVYVVGNGGSSANAAHLVLHLREKGYTTADLMADAPWLSMESNDRGYDQALAAYVKSLPAYEDACLLVISGSGNSENILEALEAAHLKQFACYGILGNDGGQARDLCDFSVVMDTSDHGIHEDCTSAVVHMVRRMV